jgi:hypothetical protein
MSWIRNTGFHYDGGSKETKLPHHKEKSKIFHEVEEQNVLSGELKGSPQVIIVGL